MRRGSLVAAADELHMSPSAASRLLSGLEQETGLTLFSRDRLRLQPTVEAEQYFQECYRVLSAVDDLPRAARRLARGAQQQLRMLSMTRVASSLTVPAIARLLKTYPDVEIEMQLVTHYELETLSAERRFDVAVGPLPLRHSAVELETLLELPATAIMRRDHPLAKRPFIGVSELARERLALGTPGSLMRIDMETMFAAEGLTLRPQITASTAEVACQFVLQANAITVLEPLIPLAFNLDACALVPIKPLYKLPIGIITPVLKPESRLIAHFKTCLREEAKALERRLATRIRKAGQSRKKVEARHPKNDGSRYPLGSLEE
jgi:DNA-binding transcriptional LysR family regulator